jgi:uridine phosphorylase
LTCFQDLNKSPRVEPAKQAGVEQVGAMGQRHTTQESIHFFPMQSDDNTCLIDPRKGRSEAALPSLAVLVFSPEDLASFFGCFREHPRRTHKLYLSEIFTASFEGTEIALAGPMLGAPQTILVLEKMIALGVRKVIATGWCGSLQKNVRIGDIVLPSGAISEEGTSKHYPAGSSLPSKDLFSSLASTLTQTGLTFHEGLVWTTDAPFRETIAKIRKFQSDGILSVDMETSALFTVSRFRGIDLAVVLVVSDDLSGLKWVHGFREPIFREARIKAIQSTLKAISAVTQSLPRS